MSAAADKSTDPRGLKRICLDCGGRFYDMNKRPITCPSCDTEFTGEIKVKARRSRVAAVVEEAEGQVEKKTAKDAATDEDEDEDEAEAAQIVSLDDLETAEKAGDDEDETAPKGDLDLDDDDDDLDDLAVDDDIGELNELEPDAEVEEGDEGKSGKK